MSDLLTRIRANVAAIPTHNCGECGTGFTPKEDDADEECTQCGYIGYGTSEFGDSDADALLREVAALEPAAYFNGGDLEELAGESHGMWMIGCPSPEGSWHTPLYTITGATHDAK